MTPSPFTKLYVEITTTCNLDCETCIRRAWNEPISRMPLASFEQLMAQLREFPVPPTIHFGGYGEPMHHPDFLAMVGLAKKVGARVEMTTNGMLMTAKVAETLVDLEVDRIVVSIDGVTPEHYGDIRHRGEFERVIANMQELRRITLRKKGRQAKPKVGIAFVAMKRNVMDLPELPRLATRLGAKEIVVSNLVPHSREMEKEILYEQSLTACTYRQSPWVADMSLPKIDLNGHTTAALTGVFASTASLSWLDHSLSARNDYCRFAQEGYAAVRWDGEVSPCLSLLHDHPEYVLGRRKDITHYSLGNIADRSLQDIWTDAEFTAFRASLTDFSYSPCTTCGGCERFPQNYIDCTGNSFPTCGGCLWAQGFIQCP
jgi:MoaA/NifB/PqqE/SkfB family radical SAM enzyme